jgi:phosphoglycerate dehydrogenase-like enzyme
MSKLRGLFILSEDAYRLVYGPSEREHIAQLVDLIGPPQTAESIRTQPHLLDQVEVIFSGWGAPVMDDPFLDSTPKLKAVFYGGGAVGVWITEDVWRRGITVTSAHVANAVPVAEYTLAVVLLSLKHAWALSRQTRQTRHFPPRDGAPGSYGSTIGLISLGTTARTLLKLLEPFDLRVLAYDPYVSATEGAILRAEMTGMHELFRRSDVVSVHTPLLDETIRLIRGEHLACMKPGATFINTARGPIVDEGELIDVLMRRPDLQAVLDVTEQEPPAIDSPLYTLPNVVLTPHIAGSVGRECRRMGRYMVEELRRYVAGQPLRWKIAPESAVVSSHRPVNGGLSLKLTVPGKLRSAPANPTAAH